MGQCNSAPTNIPVIKSPADGDRQLLHNALHSNEFKAFLASVFARSDAEDTAQYDRSSLVEMNMLGFITTDSQPGLCVQSYNPIDFDQHLQAMQLAIQYAETHNGEWRYRQAFKEMGGQLTKHKQTGTSQRAYVSGFLFQDEADELFDLVNRTDIVCILGAGQAPIPVTYQYANFSKNPAYWPGYPPITTRVATGSGSGAYVLPPSLESFQSKLTYVECFDPQHGRLASQYMYKQVLLPLMRAIRARHPVK